MKNLQREPPQLINVTRLDNIRLDDSYFTSEGYFVDTPIVTRTGIFEYKNPDGSIRRELRLPEHVFDPKSLASYKVKPVIITHAARHVDKDNVDDEIVGTVLSKGYKDGDAVRVKIVIHDIDAVKQSGLRELSLGYSLALDETPGTWNGQPYDAIQTNIKVNHLALVRDARAGDEARLNLDSRDVWADSEQSKESAHQNLKGAAKMDAEEKKQMSLDDLKKEIDMASPGDKIKAIKERYENRRKDSTPPKPEELPALIAQQDSEIDELLKQIEIMQAKKDYDSAAAKDKTGDRLNREAMTEKMMNGGICMKKEMYKEAASRCPEKIMQPYDLIIDIDGFDAICTFSEQFSGSGIYVPKLRTIFSKCLEQYIIEEWDGGNMLELVRGTGFTERHIRNLLKR